VLPIQKEPAPTLDEDLGPGAAPEEIHAHKHSFGTIPKETPAMKPKRLQQNPSVDATARVVDSRLGHWTEVGPNTTIVESELGDYSYAINDCDIIYTSIGKFCSLASHVRINPGNHPLDRPALHHFTYRSDQFDLGDRDADFFDWRRSHTVSIGHDVWVGHGAMVLPGVTIGNGAAVGAGSVVTKDVPDFCIVAGVPAKPLRFRFEEQVRKGLLKIQWWHWPHEQLRTRLADFRRLDAAAFVAKYA
jgi:phosphonate metabolism protein (transferase hexapeptide repeat family)